MHQFLRQGSLRHLKQRAWFRLLCLTVLVTYCIDLVGMDLLRTREAYAQSVVVAPVPGVLLPSSAPGSSPLLKAISLDPADPFKINFLVDAGDHARVDEKESSRLIKYFLTCLTIPEKDLWVNLSPSEPGRIVDKRLGATTVGADMLREDYLLKQLAASMTFPDREPGKAFWKQVYVRIKKKYGDLDLPVDTFSKVWVVPAKAVVYEQAGKAFIAESRLKVMLDEDYLTNKSHVTPDQAHRDDAGKADDVYRTIAREIIIPELEREVNDGQYFAPLRQIFSALILAIWFKRKLRHNIMNRVYADQKKTSGIQTDDRQVSQKVYAQYMLALKKGVYDVIREDYDTDQQETVARHYFSGGFSFEKAAGKIDFAQLSSSRVDRLKLLKEIGSNLVTLGVSFIPRGMPKKMLLALAMVSLSSSVVPAPGLAPRQAVVAPKAVVVSTIPRATPPPVIATTTPEAVSEAIIKRGDKIPEADQKYLTYMKEMLTLKDVQDLHGTVNASLHMTYAFDMTPIENNWDAIFTASTMGWRQEVVVMTVQQKLGITADGIMGPETRRALNAKIGTKAAAPAGSVSSQVSLPQASRGFSVVSDKAPFSIEPVSLTAPSGGVVNGFDVHKTKYRKGEPILKVLDPGLAQQIAALKGQLSPLQQRLKRLKALQAAHPGAITDIEITTAGLEVQNISQQLAPLIQIEQAGVLRAPYDFLIKEIRVGNGQTVSSKTVLLDYLSGQMPSFTLRMTREESQNLDHKRITIDGQPVTSNPKLDIRIDPLKPSEALVTFVVTTALDIQAGSVHQVKVEVPASVADDGLALVKGVAHTTAKVGSSPEIPVVTLGAGPVNILVRPGQEVFQGQVAAIQPGAAQAWHATKLLYDQVDVQLKERTSGNGVYFTTTQTMPLETRRASLKAQLQAQGEAVGRSFIKAPCNGTVTTVSLSGAFTPGSEIFRLNGPVRIGDLNDPKGAIFVSGLLDIKNGDPVLVRTGSGRNIPARITNINKMPVSPGMDLQGLQSLEVTAMDPDHYLGLNMRVTVIVLTDAEKLLVAKKLVPAMKGQPSQRTVAAMTPVPGSEPPRKKTVPMPEPVDLVGPIQTAALSPAAMASVPPAAPQVPSVSNMAFFQNMPVEFTPSTEQEVEIGKVGRNIEALKKLVGDLQDASRVLAAREAVALALTSEKDGLNLKIQHVGQRLADAEDHKRLLMDNMGQTDVEKKDSRFHWDGQFPRFYTDKKGAFDPPSSYLNWNMSFAERRAVNDMKALSVLIRQQNSTCDSNRRALEEQSRILRKDQLVDLREKVTDSVLRLNELKAQYFKACLLVRGHLWDSNNWGAPRVPAEAGQQVTEPRQQAPVVQAVLAAVTEAVGAPRPAPVYHPKTSVRHPDEGISLAQPRMSSTVKPPGDGFMGTGVVSYDESPLAGATGADGEVNLALFVHDPNPLVRMEGLDLFLQQGQGLNFIANARQAVLTSPFPDVQARILGYMVERKDAGLRFVVSVLDEAIRKKQWPLVEIGFQSLSDILAQDPALKQHVSDLNYASGTPLSSLVPVAPEGARKVLLTFLSRDGGRSKAGINLLRHMPSDQLDQICHTLESSGDPRWGQLKGLLLSEIMRQEAGHGIEDIQPGPFQEYSTAYTWADQMTFFLYHSPEGLKHINEDFLKASPHGADPQGYLPQWLRDRALKGVQKRLASAPPLAASSLIYDLPPGFGNAVNALADFNSLLVDARQKDILQTQNIEKLGRIFASSTVHSRLALDKLMKTPAGIIRALQAYAGSKDPEVRKLMKNHAADVLAMNNVINPLDCLSMPIRNIPDPVSMGILRHALEQLYQETNDPEFLNLRLKTFGFIELSTAKDPRGQHKVGEQIEAEAIRLSLALLDMIKPYYVPLSSIISGQHTYDSGVQSVIDDLGNRINAGDPREVSRYLEEVQRNGGGDKKQFANDINSWEKAFVSRISRNDQGVQGMPLWNVVAALGAIGFVLSTMKKNLYNMFFLKWTSIAGLRRMVEKDLMKPEYWIKAGKKTDASMRNQLSLFEVRKIPDEKGFFYKDTGDSLKQWAGILGGWSKPGQTTPQSLIQGFNDILNNVAKILYQLPYTPQLMGVPDAHGAYLDRTYINALSFFITLTEDTLTNLDTLMQPEILHALSPSQRQVLSRDRGILVEKVGYAIEFLAILELRGVMDKWIGEKRANDHKLEKGGFFPFLRTLLFRGTGLLEKKLFKRLPGLLEKGEALMPGLYPADTQEAMVLRSQEIFDAMEANGTTMGGHVLPGTSDTLTQNSTWRQARTAIVSLAVVAGVVLSFGRSSTLPAIVVAFLGLFLYMIPNIKLASLGWETVSHVLIRKLDAALTMSLGPAPRESNGDAKAVIIKAALQEADERLKEALAAQKPYVDMVVIVPQDGSLVNNLDTYVAARRGKIFRHDVPVEVMAPQRTGSANLNFEVMQLVEEKLRDTKFLEEYPYLKDRALEDIRVMVVLHGNNEVQHDKILDLAIVNGYRIFAVMPQGQGGYVLMYSRDAYLGPVPEAIDQPLSVFGHWVGEDGLMTLGLLDLIKKRVLEKLNIKKLKKTAGDADSYGGSVLKYLGAHFDLSKEQLEQYPGGIGITVFNPSTVSILAKILHQLQKDPDLWDKLNLQMTLDIIDVLKISSQAERQKYINKRITLPDIEQEYAVKDPERVRLLLSAFYGMFNGPSIPFTDFLPHPGAAVVKHLKTAEDRDAILRLLQGWRDDAAALVPVQASVPVQIDNGGLDLSRAQDQIEWRGGHAPEAPSLDPVYSGHAVQFLQLFRGFDFRITASQPLEDPKVFLGF